MIAALAWPFVALVGIAVVAVFAWRLLPARALSGKLDALQKQVNVWGPYMAELPDVQHMDKTLRNLADSRNDLVARVSKLEMSKAFGRAG